MFNGCVERIHIDMDNLSLALELDIRFMGLGPLHREYDGLPFGFSVKLGAPRVRS
jgi:hypothetical protein